MPNVSELSHDRALGIGTWELISGTSAGYGSPPTTAPVRAGTESYAFGKDGTADVYRDRQPVEPTVWSVEELPCGAPSLRIGTETDHRRECFGVTPSRLCFDHRPVDGPLLGFARR